MNIVEKVRKHVENRYENAGEIEGRDFYETHVVHVVEFGKELAKKLNADEEVVEIAALFHDIARLDGNNKEHHVLGADYAEEFLKKENYNSKKIENIKHCIIAHRGSVVIPRETVEAECIASADAMTHFITVPEMLYFVFVEMGKTVDEGKVLLKAKLDRSYKKMIPEAQEMVKDKYEAALKILG